MVEEQEELTEAGIKSDSEGLMKDSVKDPGRNLNFMVMKTQFMMNRTRLNRNRITPMIRNHSA